MLLIYFHKFVNSKNAIYYFFKKSGFNNNYLIATRDNLSLIYNGKKYIN